MSPVLQLERRITTITPKVLTQRRRQLERDGLVCRTYFPEVPPRVEYEISDLGRSLRPLFAALAEWSAANLSRVEQGAYPRSWTRGLCGRGQRN